MNQTAMLADFARHTDMDVLMLAGRYTLLDQSALDDLLPVCERRGIGIVAAGVFNSGLLARRTPADGAKYDYGDAPEALVLRARRMAEICERHGTSLPAVALAFPLAHPAVLERVRRRALAGADRAQHRSLPVGRARRCLGRVEGAGPPASGCSGTRCVMDRRTGHRS